MRNYHRETSRLTSFLLTGVLAGAITFIGLWLCCLLMISGFSVMGVEAAPIAKMVFEEFLGSVIWIQVRILVTYAVIGAFMGLVGAIIVIGFFGGSQRRLSRWWAFGAGIIFSLIAESLFLTWTAQRTPQLFADFFYLPGGWTQQVMVFITDQLPGWIAPAALLGLAAFAVIATVILIIKQLSSQRQWRGWPITGSGLLLAISAIALMVISGSKRTADNPPSNVPGIILLAADSFRFDHLSGMGYHRPTSPNIDSLISRGTVFSHAITPLPRTFPAWLSYLTGTYPQTHGVLHMFPTQDDREHIPRAVPEILGEHGWHSGVISDFAGDIFSRIELGFKKVSAPEFTFITLIKMRSMEIHWALMPYVNTEWGRKLFPILAEFAHAAYPQYLGTEARRYIKQRARKQEPFLLTVFFSATHFPYSAPGPFYHMFTNPDYDGDYKYHKPNLLKAREDLTTEDIEHILALYDGAVRAVDNEIGKILTTLEDTELANSTWIIITADHGENLYEGELGMGHGEHLRGHNVINIPLIVIPPKTSEVSIHSTNIPVSGVDIGPTLLDMAGLSPDSAMEGWSLLPLMEANSQAADEFRSRPVFSETGLWFADWTEGFYQHQRMQYPDVSKLCRLDPFHGYQIVLKDEVRDLMETAKHRAVILDSLKLIIIPTRDGVIEEAYRISGDGTETPVDPQDLAFFPLREAMHAELVSNGNFREVGNHIIPEGSYWRLNRRVAMER